ncbi:MAG: hypothetical protein WC581_03665 [Thermodesulfovibrionales bacterium]
MEPNVKEITIRDSITAGICKAFNLEVTPQYNPKEVVYNIRGNVDEVLQKIAENVPIGSRDVLESIKNCRSAIFLFRQGIAR